MATAHRVRVWASTAALGVAAAAGVAAVLATGAPALLVAVGVVALAGLAGQSWRSGARFEAEAHEGRPLDGRDPPVLRRALLDVCERAGRPVPRVVAVRMDVPGVMVGYDDGESLLAVDPRLSAVVGPAGLRALYAHELGHLGGDVHTDALREFLPQTLGFAAWWVVFLAGRGPALATAGAAGYLALALSSYPVAWWLRAVASLGVEPLALAVNRYANRHEEHLADAYAAHLVSPDDLVEALYRVAAIATGTNDEDVTGPVPWDADRSPWFAAFATHPSIERRAAVLGCDLPAWVQPYRPHRGEVRNDD